MKRVLIKLKKKLIKKKGIYTFNARGPGLQGRENRRWAHKKFLLNRVLHFLHLSHMQDGGEGLGRSVEDHS